MKSIQQVQLMWSISQEEIENIGKSHSLGQEEFQILKMSFKKKKPQIVNFRDVLCEQRQESHQAFYIIEGCVNVLGKLSNNESTCLFQAGRGNIVNLQIFINQWVSRFTISAASTPLKYIILQEKQVIILAENIEAQLKRRMQAREKQLMMKNKKIYEAQKNNRMEKMISKLSLPNIQNDAKELIDRQNRKLDSQRSHLQDLKAIKNFSRQLQPLAKVKSLPKIQLKDAKIPQTYEQKERQKIEDVLLSRFHQLNDQKLDKMARLKSERSLSIYRDRLGDHSRNEKIFKAQLKSIVKRKIVYQRKHFKILKAFHQQSPQQLNKQVIKKYDNDNPIDDYFNL